MRKRWPALVLSVAMVAVVGTTGAGTAVAKGPATAAPARPAKPYTRLLKLSIRDIQEYWTEEFPAVFGAEYEAIPSSRIQPYNDSTDFDSLSTCTAGSDFAQESGNAFYCGGDDTVNYDDQKLLPELYSKYNHNAFAIAVVFAHEWGHAIQRRFLSVDDFVNTPTVYKEQQADCVAGSWSAYVDKGKSRNLELEPGDLDQGISALLDLRDPSGIDSLEEGAHGNGFDRVGAFQFGFENGAAGCADLLTNPRVITETPFTSATDALSGGNLPASEIIDATKTDLDLYWGALIDNYTSVNDVVAYSIHKKKTLPACKSFGLKPSHPKAYAASVFYCSDNDTIAFDGDYMTDVYNDTGDFGVMVLISNAWASAMQARLDIRSKPLTLGFQSDCFSGAYTGSIPVNEDATINARNEPVDRPVSGLSLSPGDLDEAVQAFLIFGDPPDAAEAARGTAFERMEYFRQGFFNGEADCLAITE